MRCQAWPSRLLVREGAKAAAVLLVEVRADIRAAFSIDKRGLAHRWRDYASEFIGYAALAGGAFVILALIFGLGV